MFLFNKKTRNIIKYMWGFFAIIISLTMVIAYSGFTSLARTQPAEQIEIPPEIQAQLETQKQGLNVGSTPEEQAVFDAINEGRLDISAEASTTSPPTQEFKLEI